MNSITARFIAVVLVAVLPAACSTAVPRLSGEVPGAEERAVQPTGAGTGPAPLFAAAPPPPPPVTVSEDPDRPWLRAVSTAPMRPRLAGDLPAAEPRSDQLLRNARIRVDGLASGALDTAMALPGVAFATRLNVGEVPVRGEDGRERLRVAFVDPGGFRVFTPKVTGEAEALWRAVGDGQVAVTHEASRELGLAPGADARLGRLWNRVDRPIAGAVSLGRAGVADVVASSALLDSLEPENLESVMLVSVRRLADIRPVAMGLEAASVGRVSFVDDPEPYRAELVGDDEATVAAFEPFAFTHRGGGRLTIEQGWIDRNIVTTTVPILGEVRCHRLLIPQLRAALTEIVEAELSAHVDANDYGGCWFPRHIGWDETRSLSMHAWGLAVDFNVQTNLMGRPPTMDPRIVEIFERHGFNWGGRWRVPDGMHFELGVLPDAE